MSFVWEFQKGQWESKILPRKVVLLGREFVGTDASFWNAQLAGRFLQEYPLKCTAFR